MLRVIVLISGSGSNLHALLERTRDPEFSVQVVAVGADRDAPGLEHARAAGIPVFTVTYADHPGRAAWGEALAEKLRSIPADAIVLSGLMRLLPDAVVAEFAPRIINTHPAYLPEFPGAHAVRDALAAGATETGASVIVVDDGVDSGPILARERVPVEPGDTEQSLHERIKVVERRLLEQVLRDLIEGTPMIEENQ